MKEIILDKQLPVITMNFEEVKTSLQATMDKYKGIVVTAEGLKDCKATQRDLSASKKKIDDYRKQVKKDMEVPIKAFEGQCKELIALIDEVEKPIKEGIKVFNDKVRNEKMKYAENIIAKTIKGYELEEKFSSQLNVLDSYTNLTVTLKGVREDIEVRAKALKDQQDQEKAQAQILKATIIATVEGANATINTKLKAEDFYKYIDRGYNVAQVVSEINRAAELVRRTEKAAEERAIQEQRRKEEEKIRQEKERIIQEEKAKLKTIQEFENKAIDPIEIPETPQVELQEEPQKHSQITINFEVTGKKEKLMILSNFLKSNDYNYKVISQKAL
ncbi:hypothetical protein GCM10008908_24320 [Clostridium subterminale]|uniref:DUF1351 domain-containing protein n=1 Tax=Clostridium subterminale TaxID=1550 RepID=A0ABN1KSD2_CLOSU